jgi:annexin A7/11
MSIEADAEALRKAMKGFGTDEDALIKIVANRSNSQRLQIKDKYKQMFGRDLISDLKSELRGKLEDAMVALFTDPIEYDCDSLKRAMKGAGTDEDSLIEILVSRPVPVLEQIKKKYKEKYKNELENNVKSDTSGETQRLLVSILQCKRSQNRNPNPNDCAAKAQELFKAGEGKKWGTDSDVFNKIFTLSSPAELIQIAQQYHKIAGKTILQAIDAEYSGSSKKILKSIVYALISPSEYFATRVNDAIKGFGTNDHLLIRVLITRDEIDMPQIKQYYKQLYGKDMVEAVKADIGGDYRKLMIELCSH